MPSAEEVDRFLLQSLLVLVMNQTLCAILYFALVS